MVRSLAVGTLILMATVAGCRSDAPARPHAPPLRVVYSIDLDTAAALREESLERP